MDRPFFRKRILRPFKIAETIETPEQWEAFRRFHGCNAALDIDRSELRQQVRSIEDGMFVLRQSAPLESVDAAIELLMAAFNKDVEKLTDLVDWEITETESE